jgi:hypothetical protein
VPDLEAIKANPENKALPPIDIRDVLDAGYVGDKSEKSAPYPV